MENNLMHFNKARQEIALAKGIDEVKDIRDKAEVLRAYARQAGYSLEMQNQCAEIKIRAERKAGELIPDQITIGTKAHDVTLSDLGIEHNQSVRWQSIASIPEDKFEERIINVFEAREELTSAGFIRYAAIWMLGWTEVQVNQINTEDDIDKLLKTLAENIMRLDMVWPEEVRAKAEIDQLMREKYGEAKHGGDRKSKNYQSSPGELWSIEKTAELLNQTKGHLSEDLQLARDLEEDPELERIKRKSFAKRTVKQKQRTECLQEFITLIQH
jgi:hypothetical protein